MINGCFVLVYTQKRDAAQARRDYEITWFTRKLDLQVYGASGSETYQADAYGKTAFWVITLLVIG